jgi:hypothetical protein
VLLCIITTSTFQMVMFGEKIYPLYYKITRDTFYTPHLITRSTYADFQKIKDIVSKLDLNFSTVCRFVLKN